MVKTEPVGIDDGKIERAGDYQQQDNYQDMLNFELHLSALLPFEQN
jgi:hypothetical protein